MKVAHVIMAYKNPGQIMRMIKALEHPNFYFFIHLDLKIDLKPFEFLERMERVYFINNRVVCNWGGFSFVNAIVSSISEIIGKNEDYKIFNLLSGQDYPIKSPEFIYSYYQKHHDQCFIAYDDDPTDKWWSHAIRRAEYYHLTDFNFPGRYLIQNLLNRFLPKRKFPLQIKLYGSSNSSWWTISEDCAVYILDYLKRNRGLTKFMRYTWGADEFLITSIIMNSPFIGNTVNTNHRLIKWSEGFANPKILTVDDFNSIKISEHFYARKFDTNVDVEIMDKIDAII